jgi:4-amino-4-deoxy-L-arabinose transferase-like glycosyltransferase
MDRQPLQPTADPGRTGRKNPLLWPELVLLLLQVGLRLHRLGLFPVFIDETLHIMRARDTLDLHPLAGVAHGKALIPWLLALVQPLENAVWASRAMVVLVSALGLAALLALGRRLLGRRVALVAGLLYVALPFTFFFERLAMSDGLAAAFGLLSGWLVAVALGTADRRIAPLAGLSLALAILTRLSMVIVLALPALGWLLLAPDKRRVLRLIALMYAVCALALAPVVALAWRVGLGISYAEGKFASAALASLFARLGTNVAQSIAWLRGYVGLPLLVLGALGIAGAALRRDRKALYVAGLALLPIAELWLVSTLSYPRYYLPAAGSLLLLASALAFWAIGWDERIHKRGGLSTDPVSGRLLGGVGLLALALILLPMLRFIQTAYTDPASLPLPAPDNSTYIRSENSGYGVVEAAAWLASYTQQVEGVTTLCAVRATCERLSDYLYGTPHLEFARTDVLTPSWLAEQTAAGRVVLIAEDDPPPATAYQPTGEYRLEAARSFARPGGQSSFVLWQIFVQE